MTGADVGSGQVWSCPSAQPEMDGAEVLGVIDHASEPPEVQYLDRKVPASPELLQLAMPARPTEVFRFAAPCQESLCSHWSDQRCGLVTRIVELIPIATLALPRCQVRATCRWYHQAGRDACRRCPHVVTQDQDPSDAMRIASVPSQPDLARSGDAGASQRNR